MTTVGIAFNGMDGESCLTVAVMDDSEAVGRQGRQRHLPAKALVE